ncbi:MAG: Uncharacterised protein [Pseudidiomarina mangrovi]|nr:MAG: Uncharacterised protein [Pseudidiomarina mangrovi]
MFEEQRQDHLFTNDYRQKYNGCGGRPRDNGQTDFGYASFSGLHQIFGFLFFLLDALRDYYSVIYQHTHSQHQAH